LRRCCSVETAYFFSIYGYYWPELDDYLVIAVPLALSPDPDNPLALDDPASVVDLVGVALPLAKVEVGFLITPELGGLVVVF